jgi:DNA repair photolyase
MNTTTSEAGKLGGSAKSQAKKKSSITNGKMGGRPSNPVLNDDGVSVKGCNMIYAPKGQALEYSALAVNPYRGCGHKCAYCYVPRVIKLDRKSFNTMAVDRKDFLPKFLRDARKYQKLGISEQAMLSFTTDPYHPFDTSLTTKVLEILQDHGLSFCTLTKGGSRALRDIDLFRSDRDCFASTLTTLDDDFSKKWEGGAALPIDRINTLEAFHNRGIFTWVSLEPTLSTEASISIVKRTHDFVDLYKIGRANYLPMTNTTDWESYTHSMCDLMHKLGKKHYIKKDLQKYLPQGYYNPLRINQFNGDTVKK